MNTKKLSRRQKALVRLEASLERGVKKSKDGKELIPLNGSDLKRMEAEIQTLKGRI